MKLKQLIAFILAVALVSVLSACGGGSTKPAPAPESEAAAEVETASTETPASVDAAPAGDNGYNLDYTSEEWQDMSADRSPLETLESALASVKPLPWDEVTYEEVAELFGCEASQFRREDDKRVYRWISAEDEYTYCAVLFAETNGAWFYRGGTSQNF